MWDNRLLDLIEALENTQDVQEQILLEWLHIHHTSASLASLPDPE
jgi:hypothetical protein